MTSTVALPETTTPSNPVLDYRPRAMTGMAYGAIIMGFFGCLWLTWALASMDVRTSVVIAAVPVFAASLWIPAAGLLRKGLSASKQAAPLTPEDEREQSRMGKIFGLVFAAEGVLIFLAINVLNNLHLGDCRHRRPALPAFGAPVPSPHVLRGGNHHDGCGAGLDRDSGIDSHQHPVGHDERDPMDYVCADNSQGVRAGTRTADCGVMDSWRYWLFNACVFLDSINYPGVECKP